MKFRTLLLFSTLFSAFLCLACAGMSETPTSNRNTAASSSTSSPSPTAVQTVHIESADNVILVGSFYGSVKENSPGVILLHQWQSDRHSFDDLAKLLQARTINVLSIDGRGFGESTRKADGSPVSPGRTDADVKAMLGDVDATLKFLKQQKSVNSSRLGIVGASYGSSLAIIYAADHPDVSAVVLLSPGLNYFGNMPTEPAVKKLESDQLYRQLLFFAAEDDKASADAVRKLNPIAVDNHLHGQHIFASGGHGTALLRLGADKEISDFFAQVFDLANLQNLNN